MAPCAAAIVCHEVTGGLLYAALGVRTGCKDREVVASG
jgi:hypothetical protein